MAQIPQTNVSIAAINTEVASVNSHSLTTLSTNAISAGTGTTSQMINISPYGMGEFRGYVHSTPYSNVGPDTLIIGGASAGASMTFWSDTTEFQNNFIPATFISGFDVRVILASNYNVYTGLRKYVTQNFQKNATNGVYRNTSNQQVTMSGTTQYPSHFQTDLGGLDYMSAASGFDEFKLVWSNNGIQITGSTTGASGSFGQQNISGHTAIANGTWYSAGPEGNTGTYGTTINLYGSRTNNTTGSASIGSTLTLETWVRNVGLNKSETKIRTQDIYLQGDATILAGGGGGGYQP